MSERNEMDPELGREVGIGVIDGELKKLWDEDEARTNASLINVAIYSEEVGSLRRNSKIIGKITRDHACRALLIEIDRLAAEPAIRSWITAHCHLSGGQKAVCCEQIAFELKGRSRGRLRNTVFAHLASDLPLIFWWQGELSSLFEESLYSLMDRFIFDSSDWLADPRASFERIEAAVTNSSRQLVVQDLAWTRTYHYRLAVAGLFDSAQAQAALGQIASVEVIAHPEHRMSALQLVAWLSTQAGWSLAGVERAATSESIRFAHKSAAEIKVLIRYEESSAPLGSLVIAGGGIRLRVWRDPGNGHLFHQLEAGETRLDGVSPADSDEDVDLIGDQLARGGKNSLYRRMLPRFLELLRF